MRDRWDTINDKLLESLFLVRMAKHADPYMDDNPSGRIEGVRVRRSRASAAQELLEDVIKLLEQVKP